jgi:hypothetical protein
MTSRSRAVPLVALVALSLALVAGCAGTRSTGELSDDPVLIQKELVEIEQDMLNVEELIKGTKAQLQYEDSQGLRDDLRQLEMDLIHLESQQRALNERLAEIEASRN